MLTVLSQLHHVSTTPHPVGPAAATAGAAAAAVVFVREQVTPAGLKTPADALN